MVSKMLTAPIRIDFLSIIEFMLISNLHSFHLFSDREKGY